jgi:TolB-like protein/Tfp pilus assembly protein PilF
MGFFQELRRRNVYKVAVAYVVVAWLLIQAASILFPTFDAPSWVMKVFVALVAAGFPIALVVAWAFELTPEGIKRSDEVAPEASIAQKTGRKLMAGVAAVALLAVGLLLFQIFSAKPDALKAGGALSTVDTPADDKSIAVLPFDNFNRDPQDAYFADGIQDEILTRLAKIDDLKVISRTSTQRYKSSPENLPEIAKQLGVAHVIEGSVQKAGDQVRVTVQLIRAATDSHVWAETYDRKLTDIFAVQSDIAENIARALRTRLSGREKQAVSERPTENPEAYDAYLRGLALWNKLTTSPEDLSETVRHFTRATELDPKFAVAWASLCVAHIFTYAEFETTPRRLALGEEALDRATALQPDHGDVHFARGMYEYRGRRDFEAALRAFDKARERSANKVKAIEFSAYVKRRQGKWDEAIRLHDESIELDPRNPLLLSEAALTYRSLRRFKDAHALLERTLEIEPNSLPTLAARAEIFAAEGDIATANRLAERLPLDGRDPTIFETRLRLWIVSREYPKAIVAARDLIAAKEQPPAAFVTGYRALLGIAEALAGNAPAADEELTRAREELTALRASGNSGRQILRQLILVNAFLRDKPGVDRLEPEARQEIEEDAVSGPTTETVLAIARAQLGEVDAAVAAVKRLLTVPGDASLTPALLRLDPLWDPLRNDPRFQELAARNQ